MATQKHKVPEKGIKITVAQSEAPPEDTEMKEDQED